MKTSAILSRDKNILCFGLVEVNQLNGGPYFKVSIRSLFRELLADDVRWVLLPIERWESLRNKTNILVESRMICETMNVVGCGRK